VALRLGFASLRDRRIRVPDCPSWAVLLNTFAELVGEPGGVSRDVLSDEAWAVIGPLFPPATSTG